MRRKNSCVSGDAEDVVGHRLVEPGQRLQARARSRGCRGSARRGRRRRRPGVPYLKPNETMRVTMRGAPPEAGPKCATRIAPQLVDARVGRVDDPRRARAQRREALALEAHAVEHGERALGAAGACGESGCGRRVSLKRWSSVSSLASRKSTCRSRCPPASRSCSTFAHLAEERADAHVDAERDARHPAALAERDRLRREQRRAGCRRRRSRGPRARAAPATCRRPTGR